MVTAALAGMSKHVTSELARDLQGFIANFSTFKPPAPGMYTYRIRPPGGKIRIHLRIEEGGCGVLFVDVSDVVHLNETAAEMAKLALDGISLDRAKLGLLARYQRTAKPALIRELEQIYVMIARFSDPVKGDCPTCAVEGLERAPLFSTRARAPYKADLALTYGCNNECPHCYNEPDRFAMPSLTKEHWFDVLGTLHAVGVPHIIFTGGEATLHPDLPEIVNRADTLGMVTGLNTNGRRIAHKPYMRTLAESGLNHVQVTLGSNREQTHNAMMGADSFKQTVRGIENALSSNVHAITNTTLMRCNRDHVEEIIDFLFRLGVRTFAMNGMIYSGGGFFDPNAIPEDEMQPLLIRVRDRAAELGMRFLWYTPTEYCRMSPVELEIGAKRCNAGEYSICVEPNGDVLPCQSFYAAAGNILQDPWERIWQSELFRTFRDRENDPRWAGLPEKCWQCPDLPLCGGGCRIEREARDGIRSAGETGGGCDGCGGSCGTARSNRSASNGAGFIPLPGTTSRKVRANGVPLDLAPVPTLALGVGGPIQARLNETRSDQSCASPSCGCGQAGGTSN